MSICSSKETKHIIYENNQLAIFFNQTNYVFKLTIEQHFEIRHLFKKKEKKGEIMYTYLPPSSVQAYFEAVLILCKKFTFHYFIKERNILKHYKKF